MPTIVAYQGNHKNTQAISTANFFFGWTGIGWIICLIWAQCKSGSNTNINYDSLKTNINYRCFDKPNKINIKGKLK